MSAQDIIAELPSLSQPELEQVDTRLHELLQSHGNTPTKSWGEALLELAGSAQGLPSDLASNHDNDLHGSPRQ